MCLLSYLRYLVDVPVGCSAELSQDSDYDDISILPHWIAQLRDGTFQPPQQYTALFAPPAAAAAAGAAGAAGSGAAAAAGSSAAAAAAGPSRTPSSPDGSANTAAQADSSIDPALVAAERLRRLHRTGSRGTFCLRMTLRQLTQGNAAVKRAYESWMDSMDIWWRAEKSPKGLLDMLKTGRQCVVSGHV